MFFFAEIKNSFFSQKNFLYSYRLASENQYRFWSSQHSNSLFLIREDQWKIDESR